MGDERKEEFAVKVVDGRRSVSAEEAQKEAMMMEQLDTVCGGSVWVWVHRQVNGNCHGILCFGKSSECAATGQTAIQWSCSHAS